MNDLDFDELDKAIGGADSSAPQAEDSAPAPDAVSAAPVEDAAVSDADAGATAPNAVDAAPTDPVEPNTPAPEEAGAVNLSQEANDPLKDLQDAAAEAASEPTAADPALTADPTPVEETVPADEPAGDDAIAAPRSSGRFMDMVHHSSDMTVNRSSSVPPSPEQAPPSEATSRVATDVAPLDAAAEGDQQSAEAPAELPEESLAADISAIDFSQPEPEPTTPAEANTTETNLGDSSEGAAPTAEADGAAVEEQSGQLDSPFLPDAQVEKRPLGGVPTSADAIESTDVSTPAPTDSAPASQSIYAPENVVAPGAALPAKKGGNWVWLAIIAALIIVGGGGGFAAWFFLLK